MAEKTKLPSGVRKILSMLAVGTIGTAVAAKRLGQRLDEHFGTEDMSAFPIKKGFKGKKKKSLITSGD